MRFSPRLGERRSQPVKLMSGGEQQMVAIARALMAAPTLLLLDEPSGGLAPRFVAEIAAAMQRLKAAGVTMLMVEQNIGLARGVADRLLVLRDGRVAEKGRRRLGGGDRAQYLSLNGTAGGTGLFLKRTNFAHNDQELWVSR